MSPCLVGRKETWSATFTSTKDTKIIFQAAKSYYTGFILKLVTQARQEYGQQFKSYILVVGANSNDEFGNIQK